MDSAIAQRLRRVQVLALQAAADQIAAGDRGFAREAVANSAHTAPNDQRSAQTVERVTSELWKLRAEHEELRRAFAALAQRVRRLDQRST